MYDKIKEQILLKIQSKKEEPFILAIDGRCASGKTTLAKELKEYLQADLFHLDHFFLRPEQKTKQRMMEAGGNIDYERFRFQVLEPIWRKERVYCRRYDCKKGQLEEKPSIISTGTKYIILEGAYSLHPYFSPSKYSIRIFLSVSFEEQKKRILKRNGEKQLERFVKEWIPKEEAYFDTFQIQSICDLVFETGL